MQNLNCFPILVFIIVRLLSECDQVSAHPIAKRGLLKALGLSTNFLDQNLFDKRTQEAKALLDKHIEALKGICAGGGCAGQKSEYLKDRAVVKEAHTERLLAKHKQNREKASEEAERTLQAVQGLKLALLQKNGLDKLIIPADNGLIEGDLMLTLEDVEAFTLKRGGSTGGRAKRTSSIYFEDWPRYRWARHKPIKYIIDNDFSSRETASIRRAIRTLTRNTCLTFEPIERYSGSSHIEFRKTAYASLVKIMKEKSDVFCLTEFCKQESCRIRPSLIHINITCGMSSIGRKSDRNIILLKPSCEELTGVTIHEIMHTLGVSHTHNREDRDYFIQVLWENEDPQLELFDNALEVNHFTSYGTPYDYASILHYYSSAGSKNGKDTIKPRFAPIEENTKKMGQRSKMTDGDIDIINKMYCTPRGCEDSEKECGFDALANRCASSRYRRKCPRSCDQC